MTRAIVKRNNLPAVTEKPEAVVNAVPVQNGLGEGIGYNNPFFGQGGIGPGFPQGGGSPEQISDTTTLFTNLRWYLVSNFRQLLSQLYVEIGLVQTIVDVPVDDALRGGIDVKTKLLDENQVKELQNSMDADNDLGTMGRALKWNRLYGGAGILVLVDDQDPEEELDVEAIGPDTGLDFRAVDMWELFWDKQNTEGYDAEIQSEEFEFYDYYAKKVHKSRVLKLKGLEAPSFIRPRLRGWGFSVVEALVRSINQYLKASDLTFEVLDEFKIDVYKIKNLVTTLLGANGTNKIKERVAMANWQKNYQNAVVMDSEDDWDHKQLSFAGLAEAQTGIRKQVASDMRFPITKLFGSSDSAGLGNADQNDMENYNSMVESTVRTPAKYHILKMVQLKCQKLFGFIPDDLEVHYRPLRILTAEQEENVKEKKFNRLTAAKASGDITTQEYRDAANKGNLFDIQLDTSLDQLEDGTDDPQLEMVLSGEAADAASGNADEPGADREDSKKVANAWEEGKHPRDDDGQFGAGGGSGGDGGSEESGGKKKDHTAEIARLREEAEKAEDGNAHQKAEALREKARKLEKEMSKPAKKAPKKVSEMTVGELKKRKEVLREKSSKMVDKLNDAGFGTMRVSEFRQRAAENPMFADYLSIIDAEQDISREVERRGGPGIRLEELDPRIHKPTKNEILTYSDWDRLKRFFNSGAFDRASYEADGGDKWIDSRRESFFQNPKDEALYKRAEEASQKALGKVDWKFVTWFYKKQGGQF